MTNPNEPLDEASLAAQQAYADLLPRIQALEALGGEDLPKEMGLLKGALMQNPEACALMLPQDMGMLVAALRRVTGEAIATAAAKPKKGAAKSSKILLSAEAMQEAFDEL